MRTLRPSLVGTVMLALLAGSSGMVVAQMDADADAVYVTPVSDEVLFMDIGVVTDTPTLYSSRDGVLQGISEASDPRVSGTYTSTWHVDVDPSTGHGIFWGTERIENDGGSWEGPFSGIEYEPPGDDDYYTVNGWLTRDGDYAGYTFFFQIDAYQHGGPTRVNHGIIFKGQPPGPASPAE